MFIRCLFQIDIYFEFMYVLDEKEIKIFSFYLFALISTPPQFGVGSYN